MIARCVLKLRASAKFIELDGHELGAPTANGYTTEVPPFL